MGGGFQTYISNFETFCTCENILYLLCSHLSFFWSSLKSSLPKTHFANLSYA
jgi:hypothetical protein